MKTKQRILSALLALAMLFSCMAISVFAEETPAEPTPPATQEVTNADGSITIKEGFTIPAEKATTYSDKAAYPWAIFTLAEGETEYQFVEAVSYYSNDNADKNPNFGGKGTTNALLRWFHGKDPSGNRWYKYTEDKDVVVVLRNDYTWTAKDDPRTNNDAKINCKSLTIDLNGKTFSPASYIYYSSSKTQGESDTNQKTYGLNMTFKNGTIASTGTAFVYISQQTAETTIYAKHLNFTFENVAFAKNEELKAIVATGDLSLNPASVVFPDGAQEVNVSFKNCTTFDAQSGAAAPMALTANQEGEHPNMPVSISCEHNDANADGACDLCGYLPPVPFEITAFFGDEFKITYTSKLAAPVVGVEVGDAEGTVVKAVGRDIVAGEDGNYVIEFVIPSDKMTAAVSVKLLDASGNAVSMINAAGEVIEAYSANIFDIINDRIDASNKDIKDRIDEITAEIEAKTEELQAAINDKASMAELAELIENIRGELTDGYALADGLLEEDLGLVEDELKELEAALNTAKGTLETAIKKVEDDLAAAVASLNSAIALKADATKLAEEVAKVSAAYAAADLVLSETDEALAAADASMKAAIDKLRADVDEHTARIDSAETMNTVQLVIIIVVFVVGVVALVLPMVKGKKKEN